MFEQIKNIIFDYGNVIFQLDFKKAQNAFRDMGIKNAEAFFSENHNDPLIDEFDLGRVSPDELRMRLRIKSNNFKLSDKEIDDVWNQLLVGLPKINYELVLKANVQFRTFLLSNINEIHLDFIHNYLKSHFNINSNEELFERVYYSFKLHLRKPDPSFFLKVLNDNNLDPSQTLIIDDNLENIRVASLLNMKVLRIDDANCLEAELSKLL